MRSSDDNGRDGKATHTEAAGWQSDFANAFRQPDPAAVPRLLRYLPLLFFTHMLVGLPTLIISITLAYATFVQADATRKMQQGGALPFLSYGTGNTEDESGGNRITFSLANNGVGPALMGPIEMRYKGQVVRTPRELLERCCGYAPGKGISYTTSPASDIAVRPGEKVNFIGLPRTQANEALWRKLDRERWAVRVRSCYCSIFDDCWVIDGMQSRPKPVRQCPTDWTRYAER